MVYLLRQEKGNSARGKVVGQDGKGEVLQFGMCRRGKRELVSCLKVIRANDKGWLCSRGECGEYQVGLSGRAVEKEERAVMSEGGERGREEAK